MAGEADILPEADRLEGFLHPRETEEFFGHQQALDVLRDVYAGGRMHHAWLLAGPDGVGKATLAYRFVRYLFAKSDGLQHVQDVQDGGSANFAISSEMRAFRQVAALSHPNLLVLRRTWDLKLKRFSAAILVNEVRRLKAFINTTIDEGMWRAVIVDRADELNESSANALLKSLEEPPERTLYFLISSRAGRLPATIRSRCRQLDLKPLEPEMLALAVESACQAADVQMSPNTDFVLLALLSQGSVRRALELAQGGGLELYSELIQVLDGLPLMNHKLVLNLAERLSPTSALAEFDIFFGLLSDILRRLIRSAAGRDGVPETEAVIAQRLISNGGLADWAELWETVIRAQGEAFALNLDRRNFILETFHRFEMAARRTSGR